MMAKRTELDKGEQTELKPRSKKGVRVSEGRGFGAAFWS